MWPVICRLFLLCSCCIFSLPCSLTSSTGQCSTLSASCATVGAHQKLSFRNSGKMEKSIRTNGQLKCTCQNNYHAPCACFEVNRSKNKNPKAAHTWPAESNLGAVLQASTHILDSVS